MADSRIDYEQAISQANEIRELSRDLGDEITNLENFLARVKREWCGPASTAFQSQLKKLINEMESTKSSMSDVSSTIKSVAKEIRREDERTFSED